MQFDVFIPSHPKDHFKLPLVIKLLIENIGFSHLYVCSPIKVNKNKLIKDSKISYLLDNEVFPFEKKRISFRPNWTYQQILKFAFKDIGKEYYLTVDSDSLIIKNLSWFENETPIWRYGWEQNHKPYFDFSEHFFGIGRKVDHTCIGDIGFFNRNLINDLVKLSGEYDLQGLLNKFCNKINPNFHMSEFELYGNFVKDIYKFVPIKQVNYGKRLDAGEEWDYSELVKLVEHHKESDAEIIQVHSWKI